MTDSADRLAEAARNVEWDGWFGLSEALAAYDADAPLREAQQAVIGLANQLDDEICAHLDHHDNLPVRITEASRQLRIALINLNRLPTRNAGTDGPPPRT